MMNVDTGDQDPALPIGIHPEIKFYRYCRGAEFAPHVDDPVYLAPRTGGGTESAGGVSEFTVLLYIGAENGLKGGATRFWLKNKTVDVEPKVGRVCLHWTGKDCRHSGELVERGEKWVLRTDLLYEEV